MSKSHDQRQQEQSQQHWITILSMLAVAAAAVFLYSRALDFAFFNDDPSGHFTWMEGRSIIDFFRGSADYGYYRPLVFSVLQSLVTVAGYYAPLFHALLLILHGLNVAMVWLLALRIGGARSYAWAAALIFATAPFSYEAVAYVASLTHPLHVFWLLLTLLLYQNARGAADKDGPSAGLGYHVAAFAALLLALFTHENGLLIPFLLVGIEWLERPPQGLLEGLKRPFLPYLGAAVLYFFFWLVVPKNNEQSFTSTAAIFSNLLPFLQTLIYPILPAIPLSAESVGLLIGLTLLIVGLMFAVAFVAGIWRLWLFALYWFGLSSLPAVLFLSSDYLYGSPRLHYLPAIGAALFWALPVLALLQTGSRKSWMGAARTIVAAVYTLLIILPPLSFIQCELDFYEEAGAIVHQLRDLATNAPVGQELLFVNVPFFFSSTTDQPQGCSNPYPWTPVGAVVIPPYAKVGDFIRFNGGPDRPAQAVTVPAYTPGWNTHGEEAGVDWLRERVMDSAVYIFDLTSADFFNLSEAWQTAQPMTQDPLAIFDRRIMLVDTEFSQVTDSNQIQVVLQWQAAAGQESPVTAFVHLYDQDGRLVAQHDGPPAQNFAPLSLWQPGDIITDRHLLHLEAPLSTGRYTLAAGLYDPLTGERLEAAHGDNTLPDNVFIIATLAVP